jgi:hypothetical protein
MTGDEDEPCLEPGLYMKRKIPTAGLVVIPKSGHTMRAGLTMATWSRRRACRPAST